MSRVTFSLLAAAAVTVAAAGTANAQCCSSGFAFSAPVAYSGGCCNSGYAYAVQAAPVVVQAAPIVVQQPVVVRQPVIVQQQPVVQQYVVNQGPVYAGPGLTDYRIGTYYGPRSVGAYPYAGHRWGHGYRRAYYGPRPYHHRHYHRHHGPISVYN